MVLFNLPGWNEIWGVGGVQGCKMYMAFFWIMRVSYCLCYSNCIRDLKINWKMQKLKPLSCVRNLPSSGIVSMKNTGIETRLLLLIKVTVLELWKQYVDFSHYKMKYNAFTYQKNCIIVMVIRVARVSKHHIMLPNRCVIFAFHTGLVSILFYTPATKYPRK